MTRALLTQMGYKELAWVNMSAQALGFFRQAVAAVDAGAQPALGIHLLLGEDFYPAFLNQVRSQEEDRIAVIQAVFERPCERGVHTDFAAE